VVIGLSWYALIERPGSASITSSAVSPLPTEQQPVPVSPLPTEQQPVPSSPQSLVQETTAPSDQPEGQEKEFYEYGGQCASDVKSAEDDVNDVKTYLEQNQQDYDALKEEYDKKLEEFNIQYGVPLQNAEKNLNEAKQDLEYVENKLNNVQQACEY
jgi:hypothetical protein